MNPLKFYKTATVLLILLNIAILSFFITMGPPHKKGNFFGGKEHALEILKMDNKQHELFLASAKRHGVHIDTINSKQKQLLAPYFDSLFNPLTENEKDSLLQTVQTLERQKIEYTLDHFKELKNILRDDQQVLFKPFMDKILRKILNNKEKTVHPPKD